MNERLYLIGLRTHQVRTWSPPLDTAALLNVSLSADGRELAVIQTADGKDYTPTETVRILPASAPSGQLDLLSHVASQARDPDWAALSADGDSLHECSALPASAPPDTTPQSVTENCDTVSLSSGQQTVIASYTTNDRLIAASLDSSGRYLLIQELTEETVGVTQSRLVTADLRTGQLTSLPPSHRTGEMAW